MPENHAHLGHGRRRQGGGIRQRARRWARRAGRVHRLGEAEVEDLHGAVGADLDVRGFEIAVDDPLFVGGLEGLGDLPGDRAGRPTSGIGPRAMIADRSSPSTSSITSASPLALISRRSVAMFG